MDKLWRRKTGKVVIVLLFVLELVPVVINLWFALVAWTVFLPEAMTVTSRTIVYGSILLAVNSISAYLYFILRYQVIDWALAHAKLK